MKKTSLFATLISISCAFILTACGGSTDSQSYQIVIDAGSTGTRAYVYQIDPSDGLPTITNLFKTDNNIALATFIDHPEDAGPDAIRPLLTSAEAFLNNNYDVQSDQIVTSVLGTAGMRLIPGNDQALIYQSVTDAISAENLPVGEVRTISGQDEGLFQWLNINYLQSNFDGERNTNGMIEVGGASAQITFASAVGAPLTTQVNVNGNDYFVYSISFLGLGQDQARARMNSLFNQNQCYPRGYNTNTITGDFNFSGCADNYAEVVSAYPALSDINTVPNFYNQQFVGISGVFYALNFWNIAAGPSQQTLEQNINNTCYQSYADLTARYPNAFQLYNQCANATYIDGLLYEDLALGSTQLTALNSINGTPLSFTLGYVLFNTVE